MKQISKTNAIKLILKDIETLTRDQLIELVKELDRELLETYSNETLEVQLLGITGIEYKIIED